MTRSHALAVLAGTVLSFPVLAQCSKSASACSTDQVACESQGATIALANMTTIEADGNIVQVADAAGTFKTLLAAATAAGLAEALQGPGPFTVFAPTDDAFAKLPAGTVESLLKPENKATLAAILKFHVVSGVYTSKEVVRIDGLNTLEGQRLNLAVNGGSVMVDGAKVVKADIPASNGVIHVIDKVVMPATDNIVVTADKAGSFATLLAAAKAAGLAGTLSGPGPFTVFAPTDEAFAALPKGTVERLLKPENKEKLASILKYHVVSGRVYSDNAQAAGSAKSLQGGTLTFASTDGQLTVDGARIVSADIDASNGVIHVIDRVVMPK